LFANYGSGDVNRVFNYCNLLFGDPIIGFALPVLPDFQIENLSIDVLAPNDSQDSVSISFDVLNLGKVVNDAVSISVIDKNNSVEIFNKVVTIPCPNYSGEIQLNIPVKKLSGTHELTIEINQNKNIEELRNDNNTHIYIFNVYPSSTRYMTNDYNYAVIQNKLKILNPQKIESYSGKILTQLSDNPNFNAPFEFIKDFDTVVTVFNLNSLPESKRYWMRTKLENSPDWSNIFLFYKSNNNQAWFVDTTININDFNFYNAEYSQTEKGFEISNLQNELKITSAGSNEGKFASIIYNGNERLTNTFFWGIATALIDSITYEPKDIRYFVYPSSTSAPALIQYLQSLTANEYVAFVICDDGAQSVLGYSAGTPVRNEIKNFGSALIDNVKYRESWCMIGKKGAPIGSVPEAYKTLFDGLAIIDISIPSLADSGKVRFPIIRNSSGWQTITKNDSLPEGSSLKYLLYGIKSDASKDTLTTLVFSNNSATIDTINIQKYPDLEIEASLYANQNKETPIIHSVAANFKKLPELLTNYQVVLPGTDSLTQGDNYELNFEVWNTGDVDADSVNLTAELFINNKYKKTLIDSTLSKLPLMSHSNFNIVYKTSIEDGYGDSRINISIDPQNKVREVFEDNNIYGQDFYIRKDTVTSITSANVKVFFDEREIVSGDFVTIKPEIKIELKYQSLFPYDDTSAVRFYLDNKKIYYSMFKNISYDTIKRITTYIYTPELSNGAHELRINGDELIGNLEGQYGYFSNFNVSNESKILSVYNYPNPFKDKTEFTFVLTQVPDEVKIKVYTVAGRLVKEFKTNGAEISFNRISWDGKDEDGDLLANGVYLYKVLVKKNGKTNSITQKLAILR